MWLKMYEVQMRVLLCGAAVLSGEILGTVSVQYKGISPFRLNNRSRGV